MQTPQYANRLIFEVFELVVVCDGREPERVKNALLECLKVLPLRPVSKGQGLGSGLGVKVGVRAS